MASSKNNTIKEISDLTDRWRLVVRVIRRWNVYQKDSPTDLFCISMLLVDEEGGRIQASVMNKAIFQQFEKTLCEGKAYFIANFVVSENTKEYRATNHKFKITIGAQTYVTESDASIPEYSYIFFPISEIIEVKDKSSVDYLIDVIGFVTSVGSLEEYRVNNELKNKIRLTIVDEMGLSVSCVLYDDCAVNVCMHDFTGKEVPVVILLQLCRIGFSDDGVPEVCSSFNATKVSFNLKYPEVKQFIDSAKIFPSPTVSTITSSIPVQSLNQTASSLMRCHPLITIADIPEKAGEDFFLIECIVLKVDTRHGWFYDGCSRCGSKAKLTAAKAYCPSTVCKGKPINMEPKLKVHYNVQDATGKASIVLFDNLAVQFYGNTAAQMKKHLDSVNRSYDFPDELDILVGKRLLLKLRLNKYNRDFPNSSISVSSYTELTDLLNQFDMAAHDEGVVAHEDVNSVLTPNQTEHPSSKEKSTEDISKPIDLEEIGLDDVPISTLTYTASVKGKRKVTVKKNAVMKEKSADDVTTSPVKAYIKPLKYIKQEKN